MHASRLLPLRIPPPPRLRRVHCLCSALAFVFGLVWQPPSLSADDNNPTNAMALSSGPLGTLPADASTAWERLSSLRPPSEPPAWTQHPPSPDERQEHCRRAVEFACHASDLARDFYRRFPDDDRAPQAANLENRWMEPHREAVLQFRAHRFEEKLDRGPHSTDFERTKALTTAARQMRAEFPHSFFPHQWLLQIARRADLPQALLLVDEVSRQPKLPDFVRDEAEMFRRTLQAIGKPLDLEFTALDGREVRIRDVRGKVILVVGWATWCRPCMDEWPELESLFRQHHSQGLEIIGLNFDDKRDTVDRFLTRRSCTWPQHFDGLGWKSPLAQRFGITSLPTVWLVDRQGRWREWNARHSLRERIRSLLDETNSPP